MGVTSGAIEAGRAFVRIGTDDVDFKRGLNKTYAQFSAWARNMTAAGLRLFAGGVALSAPIYKAVTMYGKMGAEIARAAEITGTSVESISALKYAADQSGVSFEELVGSFKHMSAAVEGGGHRGKEAAEALAELGVSAAALKRMEPEKQMEKIADAMKGIADPDAKENFAQRIFGRGGNLLIPLLDRGSAGIANMTEHARKLGIVMSSEDATAALKFQQTLDDVAESLKFVAFTIGGALSPALKPLLGLLTDGAKSFRAWIGEHKQLVAGVAAGAASLIGAGLALASMGVAMKVALIPMGAVVGILKVLGSVAGLAFTPFGAAALTVGGLATAFLFLTDAGKQMRTEIANTASAMKADMTEALDAIYGAIVGGKWQLAAGIMFTTLKLEWLRGTGGLMQIWDDMVLAWRLTTIDGGHMVQTAFENTTYGVQKAWQTMTGFLGDVWDAFVGGVTIIWNEAVGLILKGINEVKGAWSTVFGDGSFDTASANRGVDADLNERTSGVLQGRSHADREARLAALKKEHEAAMQYIDQESAAETEAAARERNDKIAARQAAINSLKKELDHESSLANVDPTRAMLFTREDAPKPSDLQQATKQAGTFFGSVAPLLGLSGGAHERTAKATEKSAKHLGNIDKKVQGLKGGAFRFG